MSTGRPPIARISGSRDRRVVADEVELGLAALAEQHLARAGDPHLPPGELEHLRIVAGHGVTVPAGGRPRRPGSRAASRDRRARGERRDRGQVGLTERAVRLDEHGDLAAEPVAAAGHPTDVQDPVHGPVRELERPFVIGEIQRGEVRHPRPAADLLRHPVAERDRSAATFGRRPVEPEQAAELEPDREQRAHDARAAAEVHRTPRLYEPREVVRAAWGRECPQVEEPEAAGEVVDAPWAGGVGGGGEACVHGPGLVTEPGSLGAGPFDGGRPLRGLAAPALRAA